MLKQLLIFLVLVFWSAAAIAADQKYCKSDGVGVRVYFAPKAFASDVELRAYQTGFENLFSQLEVGHKF